MKKLKQSSFLFCFLLFLGCKPELPDVIWSGDYIDFATFEANIPCENNLKKLDEITFWLIDLFEVEWPQDQKITYYWLPNDFDVSPCKNQGGCAPAFDVYTTRLFHIHEIIHAILYVHGRRHPFFEEGMAVAFEGRGLTLFLNPEEINKEITKFLDKNIDRNMINYELAGAWIRYVWDNFGMESLISIYKQSPRNTSFSQFEDIFKAELSVELKDLIEDFSNNQQECDEPFSLLERYYDHWNLTEKKYVEIDCANENIFGVIDQLDNDEPGWFEYYAVIEVEEEGLFNFKVEKSLGWRLDFKIVSSNFCEYIYIPSYTASATFEDYVIANILLLPGSYNLLISAMDFQTVKDNHLNHWFSIEKLP